jgi:hypothetical protein
MNVKLICSSEQLVILTPQVYMIGRVPVALAVKVTVAPAEFRRNTVLLPVTGWQTLDTGTISLTARCCIHFGQIAPHKNTDMVEYMG